MMIRRAEKNEGAAVVAFYTDMIGKIQACKYHATWTMGVYPTAELLECAVADGQMFIAVESEKIVGAMIVNHNTNEAYAQVPWTVDANADEVMVIHLLGVLPAVFGTGVGSALVEYAKQYARENGQKVLRLDVLTDNLSAIRLYERTGFHHVKTLTMFYESTGWTDFGMYECVL